MTPWIILAVVAAFAAGIIFAALLRTLSPGRPGTAGDRALATERTILAKFLAGRRGGVMITLGGLFALVLIGLYALNEQPEPATQQAFADRSDGARAIERLAELARNIKSEQPHPEGSGLASVEEMIDRLASRLERRPEDPEGWRMLGWSYFSTQRFRESAAAYLKAIELRPAFAEFRSLRGQALVSAADGIITADATRVFDEALALNPADVRARFFKGLAKAQAGDKNAALEDWTAILNDTDSSEPWLAEIRQKVTELRQEVRVEVSSFGLPAAAGGGLLKALAGPRSSTSSSAPRSGPAAEEIRAAETMAPSDQSAMIRGMVDGLAARLEESPRDADGWIKLIRSRLVLGEADQAKQAFERALAVFDDAPREQGQIAAAARELGMAR